MKFGNLEVFALSDGFFALDGGAMFGVIPRVFWQKTNPPDERNRITLALRPLLVRTPEALVLVDTGIGDKQDQKFKEIYRVNHSVHLLDSLRKAGFRAEDVSHVINTHLHFDHCGGNTILRKDRLSEQGVPAQVVPAFPRAKYCVQREEWQTAIRPDVRSQASYRPENFLPVEQAGQLRLLDGKQELTPGVTVIKTGGHTRGHQLVVVESAGQKLVYWGDLIPTTSHINVPYIMGYDTMPLVTIEQKEQLLAQVVRERWLMCFEHDPHVAFARLRKQGTGYLLEEPQTDDEQQLTDARLEPEVASNE
ncbi:MAG: MBL fold metallo-hydrolase [candidate division WOR-3 bacterium]